MKNAQKADRYSLSKLLEELKDGSFVIPDFQREFEWNPTDVRDLIKSIFLDYYIGTLLLWKGKEQNYKSLSCETMYGYDRIGKPDYIVLDGQQRLTALYYACFSPDKFFPKRKNVYFFYIDIQKFINEEYDEAFSYDAVSKKWNALLSNREEQFKRHFFPVSMLGSDDWTLYDWLRDYEEHWKKQNIHYETSGEADQATTALECMQSAQAFSKHIKELLRDYQISYIELDKEIEVDKVCDIFTQINTKGIRLDIFDLLNALLKPKGIQLKLLWREATSRLEFADTDKMNVYVLQVMSILLQSYCSAKYLYFLLPGQPKKIRHTDGSFEKTVLLNTNEDFMNSWTNAVSAIEDAIKVLKNPRDFGAISATFIPYPSIIPAFAAIRNYAKKNHIDSAADFGRKIRKWYWASIFANRYSSSVESTSAQDFSSMKKWFQDDEEKPLFIADFEENLRTKDLKDETKKGSAVYNAIFNLLIIRGASDWVTFEFPEYDSLDDHHIVPLSWGKINVGPEINSILNRTPLTPETNRNVIRDRLPNVYLKEMFSKHHENHVYEVLESHLISRKATEILLRDNFGPDDFREFLDERLRTIWVAVADLLIKDRLDLSPALRVLDADIENIELGFRRIIISAINDNSCNIPGSIKNRVDERIEKAAKKNPLFNRDHYKTPEGYLEYFDLRECQDFFTIGTANWQVFEKLFANQVVLANKFGQLAELRNAIRHSRSCDEVTRKEGEAAVLWFKQILNAENLAHG